MKKIRRNLVKGDGEVDKSKEKGERKEIVRAGMKQKQDSHININ